MSDPAMHELLSARRLTDVMTEAKTRHQLALIASLPDNNLASARAALRGGAHAIKLHFGLTHRASKTIVPPLRDCPDIVGQIRDLNSNVPIGAVLGDDVAIVDEDLDLAVALGIDFISGYASALPARIFEAGPQILVALDHTSPAAWAAHLPPEALLEASIVPAADYGTLLTAADLLRYTIIRAATDAPLIIPTQKRIRPSDLRSLRELGADALMYGTIMTGSEPASFEQWARRYLTDWQKSNEVTS